MQLETNTWLETEKLKEILRAKERELKIWADRNQLPPDIREQVISDGRRLLEEKREFDEKSPYAHLSIGIRKQINRHLGFPILKKVSSSSPHLFYFFGSFHLSFLSRQSKNYFDCKFQEKFIFSV